MAGQLEVVKLPHHERMEVCTSRAKYRQGRKFTAIKVYTINDESQHLIISRVPALGLQDELRKLCSRYGDVISLVFIPNYEGEEFTEAYHVQYSRIQSARFAKTHLDDKSYFGSVLHVCYAPEMESIDETRAKLIQRRKEVARKTRGGQNVTRTSNAPKQYHRQKKHPALPLTAERLSAAAAQNPHCIWQGIPLDIDPRLQTSEVSKTETVYGPVKPDKKWIEAGVRERKIISLKKLPSSNSHLQSTSEANSNMLERKTSDNTPGPLPVLRFIPTQVKTARRIVFRNESQKRLNSDSEHESTSAALGSLTVEETILSVRKKIRAVSVPSGSSHNSWPTLTPTDEVSQLNCDNMLAQNISGLGMSSDSVKNIFDWIDYLVFALSLILSTCIGVYFAFFAAKKQNTTSEYLMGGRTMGIFPISMSLIASYISGISLLGLPAEMYVYGTQYWMIVVPEFFVSVTMIVVYLPVFYKLRITSSYEYLRMRFSQPVRLLGSCLFLVKMGGLKAVVWTDTLQTILMTGGVVLVLILGTIFVGGPQVVLERSMESGRLEFLNFDFDPTIRHTVWGVCFGNYFSWLAACSVNQAMVQRCLAMPTLGKANM
ncbi:Uncharacterized protein GBIM_08801 [Gryllus bimaculatus]|nr:Uncharacterized protein GBIM_08801 [Gryllus bimaculatus]